MMINVTGGSIDMSENQHLIETYKSLITISVEGFKFCALANGGAAVAILAYLGNAIGKGRILPDMRFAMTGFLLGLVACGVAVCLSYITQLELYNEERHGVSENERKHVRYLRGSMISVGASLAFFIAGSFLAMCAF